MAIRGPNWVAVVYVFTRNSGAKALPDESYRRAKIPSAASVAAVAVPCHDEAASPTPPLTGRFC